MAPKPKPADRLQRLREDGYKVRVTHLRLPVGWPVTITDAHGESFEVRSATLGAMRQHGIDPSPKGGETRVAILDGHRPVLGGGHVQPPHRLGDRARSRREDAQPPRGVSGLVTAQSVGVCGFPRSGSSLTMKMLHAGGIPPIRGSSRGSYELVGGLDSLVAMPPQTFAGCAIKLLDYGQWFPELPRGIDWRFIWLDRDPTEQAKSNVKFMRLLMPALVESDRGTVRRLAKSYRDDRPRLLAWYRARGDVLISSFEAILSDPAAESARFVDFLPTLNPAAAAAVVLKRSPACAPDLSVELSGLREEVAEA